MMGGVCVIPGPASGGLELPATFDAIPTLAQEQIGRGDLPGGLYYNSLLYAFTFPLYVHLPMDSSVASTKHLCFNSCMKYFISKHLKSNFYKAASNQLKIF